MARQSLLIAALLAATPVVAAAQQQQSRPTPPTADSAQNVYVAVYRRGPKFDPARGADNAGIKEHIRHFQALGERLVAAGTVQQTGDDLLGYVIWRATDQAAAEAWLQHDPALQAETMTAQLRRWGVTEIKGWTKAPTRTDGPPARP